MKKEKGKYAHLMSDGEVMGVGWMTDEEIKRCFKEEKKAIEKCMLRR